MSYRWSHITPVNEAPTREHTHVISPNNQSLTHSNIVAAPKIWEKGTSKSYIIVSRSSRAGECGVGQSRFFQPRLGQITVPQQTHAPRRPIARSVLNTAQAKAIPVVCYRILSTSICVYILDAYIDHWAVNWEGYLYVMSVIAIAILSRYLSRHVLPHLSSLVHYPKEKFVQCHIHLHTHSLQQNIIIFCVFPNHSSISLKFKVYLSNFKN